MPDPLAILPYEIWNRCIGLAIRHEPEGPFELSLVSRTWRRELFDSPDLWCRIWVGYESLEMARIETSLRLSGSHLIHVYVYVETHTDVTNRLHQFERHLSRIKRIRIFPAIPTEASGSRWEAAAKVMSAFSNQFTPSHIRQFWCKGGD
jgi:hypothetical protein